HPAEPRAPRLPSRSPHACHELGQRARRRRDPRPDDLEAGALMLAILRPDSWNFPLFLHVLGAMVVTGATAAACVMAVSSRRWPWLRSRLAKTLLLAVFPAWLLMRLGGAWEDSRSSIGDGSGWLGVGYIVGDLGFVLLIVAMIL